MHYNHCVSSLGSPYTSGIKLTPCRYKASVCLQQELLKLRELSKHCWDMNFFLNNAIRIHKNHCIRTYLIGYSGFVSHEWFSIARGVDRHT